MKKTKRINKIIFYVLLVLLSLINIFIFFESTWIENKVGLVSLDEVIFHIKVPLEGTSNSLIYDNIFHCFIPTIIIFLLFLFLIFYKFKYYSIINIDIDNMKFSIRTKKIIILILLIFNTTSLICQLLQLNIKFQIIDYINSQMQRSSFIEENYIDPKNVKITFPEKKKNLIYIYIESMESTYSKAIVDGKTNQNIIPDLYNLAKENVNFSDNQDIGGAYPINGTGWTIGAMVSQTAGIPLKIPIDDNEYTGYDEFLPGVTNLGDILKENGYNQTIIMGSDASFGGRRTYFKLHGNYKIKDLYTAREEGIIPKDYKEFWGFEDTILFQYAKKELSKITAEDKPFNLTLLTVNTHFPGYVEDNCKKISNNSFYANSVYCSQKQVYEFVEWLKTQDYYDNTTIILAGDHLSMANSEVLEIGKDNRRIYNAIINSGYPSSIIKKKFSTLDMFPTTLASLNVSIEGDRLGLGVNLFSEEKTLYEKYDYSYVNEELGKKSDYYNKNILY